jgi:hypothetical protein
MAPDLKPAGRRAAWYVATLVVECRVAGELEDPATCMQDVHVIRAPDRDTAYEKALRLGKSKEDCYLNSHGETVSWRFIGLDNLEELRASAIRDGTEVWSRILHVDDPSTLVRSRNELTVYKRSQWAHKTAGEIIEEKEEEEARKPRPVIRWEEVPGEDSPGQEPRGGRPWICDN